MLARIIGVAGMMAGLWVAWFAWAADPPKKTARVVIPFDFESRFDQGQYGQTLGDMIWKALHQDAGFVLPESMLDVREWCKSKKFQASTDTSLARMKEIVTKEQGGEIGIWGKIERAEVHATDVYDLWIHVVDFSVDPPRVIYEKKVRTQAASEIPHVYVKEALDKLAGRDGKPAVAKGDDASIQALWQKGPNLVQGDFEKGRSAPEGWDPLPKFVTWEKGEKNNRFIKFTLNKAVAESSGVLYYSHDFPVEEGATYRFQCRYRTSGSAVKVFIKCYDEIATEFRSKAPNSSSHERREVYRSQQNLKGPPGTWNVQTEDFTPKHTHYNPKWGRVMLYAYWPVGTVEWDDVVVKLIVPAPSRTSEKDQKPSLETKVRSKDIP